MFVSSALILPGMIVLSVGLLFPRHRVMNVSREATGRRREKPPGTRRSLMKNQTFGIEIETP